MATPIKALFTRSNQPSILSRVDLDLVCLSPADQAQKLRERIDLLNDTSAEPFLHYEHCQVMYGYEDLPSEDYTIEVHTPRIAIWVSEEDFNTFSTVTWYDGDGNELIYDMPLSYRSDSILYVKVPTDFNATRLTYAGRTIYLECPKVQQDPVLFYFTDLYGLPQCISLNRSGYKLDYTTVGNYRSYNNGLKTEYHKQANYVFGVGDDGYEKEYIKFLNGFVLSESYWCRYDKNHISNLVECSVTNVNTTIEKKEHNVGLVAQVEIHPTDAMKVEPNYMEY